MTKQSIRIIDAARRTFARHGYAGSSMAAIAEAAQISKPSLFSYFKSKDALYTAVVAGCVDELAAVVRSSARSAESAAAVAISIDALYMKHSEGARVLTYELLDERAPPLRVRAPSGVAVGHVCALVRVGPAPRVEHARRSTSLVRDRGLLGGARVGRSLRSPARDPTSSRPGSFPVPMTEVEDTRVSLR